MRFNELDSKMRKFETANDRFILPEIYIIARIDGIDFHTLTKTQGNFKTPFDEKFRDYMKTTVEGLMNYKFKITYGYTQSDEISLLFALDEEIYNRKERKIITELAGKTSSLFSLAFNHPDGAAFDCRICELPNKKLVVDYFSWRMSDSERNCLNGHAYWLLRDKGLNARAATKQLNKQTTAYKHDLLFNSGINFNDVPSWQKKRYGLLF